MENISKVCYALYVHEKYMYTDMIHTHSIYTQHIYTVKGAIANIPDNDTYWIRYIGDPNTTGRR